MRKHLKDRQEVAHYFANRVQPEGECGNMTRTDTGMLAHVERLGYSTNGNPKHAVTLLPDGGGSLRLFTRADSSTMQCPPAQGSRVRFTWHRTPSGREILDSIEGV